MYHCIITKIRSILVQLYFMEALNCSPGNVNCSAHAHKYMHILLQSWRCLNVSHLQFCQYPVPHHPGQINKASKKTEEKKKKRHREKTSGALPEAVHLLTQAFLLFIELVHPSWLISLDNYLQKLLFKKKKSRKNICAFLEMNSQNTYCVAYQQTRKHSYICKQSTSIHPQVTVYTYSLHTCCKQDLSYIPGGQ